MHQDKRMDLGPGNKYEPKKVTSKLSQGLNFTVNVDFWFCNADFCKNPEGKKREFCLFSMTLKGAHFCSCPNSKGNIL